MSSPSPGPGWWLASDGQWWPQRWEYHTSYSYNQPSVTAAGEAVQEIADELGQSGWEMVNFTVSCDYARGVGQTVGQNPNILELAAQRWTLAIYFKRPIAPPR